MPIRRMNHAVLSVSDLEASTTFYRDVLGLRLVAILPATAHFNEMRFFHSEVGSSNHHDLAIIANATTKLAGQGEPKPPGLFHIAFEVGTLDELQEIQARLQNANAFTESTHQAGHLSIYSRDPDGLAVEILWRAPRETWSYDDEMARHPLDFDSAKKRWGGQRATGSAAGEAA
jgi:catechol-2,3-dioxygenase